MPITEEKQLTTTSNQVRWLYEKYSAPLLGYISGIIANKEEGEGHLITILSRFAHHHKDHIQTGEVNWLKLLQFSRSQLLTLKQNNSRAIGIGHNDSKLDGLSELQKDIFCSIYYYGRSIVELAERIGESEAVIRSEFKVAFDKIRRAGGN